MASIKKPALKLPALPAEQQVFLSRRNQQLLLRQPRLAELRDRLQRRVPGSTVVLDEEREHLDALLKRGTLAQAPAWTFDFVEGARNACHWNTAKIHRRDPKRFDIATGYALSDDGLWRQHSWIVVRSAKVIVETTVPRLAYFGIRLFGIQRTLFLFAHRDC